MLGILLYSRLSGRNCGTSAVLGFKPVSKSYLGRFGWWLLSLADDLRRSFRLLTSGLVNTLVREQFPRAGYLLSDWVLTTNHRKLGLLYLAFVGLAGLAGLVLATVIRVELAYPGQQVLMSNAEQYLTLVSVHGIVMVFFLVIPAIFGAFGNFLLPLQLGIRDVAFPRLNSFMFWLTPGGFTLLLHLVMFDKSHAATHWVSYAEHRAWLQRRYLSVEGAAVRVHEHAEPSVLAWRLAGDTELLRVARGFLLHEVAPQAGARDSAVTARHAWHAVSLYVTRPRVLVAELGAAWSGLLPRQQARALPWLFGEITGWVLALLSRHWRALCQPDVGGGWRDVLLRGVSPVTWMACAAYATWGTRAPRGWLAWPGLAPHIPWVSSAVSPAAGVPGLPLRGSARAGLAASAAGAVAASGFDLGGAPLTPARAWPAPAGGYLWSRPARHAAALACGHSDRANALGRTTAARLGALTRSWDSALVPAPWAPSRALWNTWREYVRCCLLLHAALDLAERASLLPAWVRARVHPLSASERAAAEHAVLNTAVWGLSRWLTLRVLGVLPDRVCRQAGQSSPHELGGAAWLYWGLHAWLFELVTRPVLALLAYAAGCLAVLDRPILRCLRAASQAVAVHPLEAALLHVLRVCEVDSRWVCVLPSGTPLTAGGLICAVVRAPCVAFAGLPELPAPPRVSSPLLPVIALRVVLAEIRATLSACAWLFAPYAALSPAYAYLCLVLPRLPGEPAGAGRGPRRAALLAWRSHLRLRLWARGRLPAGWWHYRGEHPGGGYLSVAAVCAAYSLEWYSTCAHGLLELAGVAAYRASYDAVWVFLTPVRHLCSGTLRALRVAGAAMDLHVAELLLLYRRGNVGVLAALLSAPFLAQAAQLRLRGLAGAVSLRGEVLAFRRRSERSFEVRLFWGALLDLRAAASAVLGAVPSALFWAPRWVRRATAVAEFLAGCWYSLCALVVRCAALWEHLVREGCCLLDRAACATSAHWGAALASSAPLRAGSWAHRTFRCVHAHARTITSSMPRQAWAAPVRAAAEAWSTLNASLGKPGRATSVSRSGQLAAGLAGAPSPRVGSAVAPVPPAWVAYEYLNDWRALRLEREVWRQSDVLALGRAATAARPRLYAAFFQPAGLSSKLSSWAPGRLIPGWAFITPYSSRLRYTTLGKVDVALLVVFIATLGSVFSAMNYLVTYRYIGAPVFKNRRELRPFFVDALLVASRMMLVANPALLVGILLLLSDRHLGTSVFDVSGGGDTILFQHLFWFFGHPEVYIIVIPGFGLVNSLLPGYLRKRLSGRLSLQYSMYTIAMMGFAVWGHHMYMVGLANSVRTLYSTMTVMISVPASTKVLHWCVTLVQATFVWDVGFLFLLNFVVFFTFGGLSGMFVAHIGFDTLFHDTFYIVGHFHTMMAGAVVSCLFAAFYAYYAALFGIRYGRTLAFAHYALYTAGQLLTLVPMFWLGYAGMPRRVFDYAAGFAGWHSIISSGHLLTLLSIVCFGCMLAESFFKQRPTVGRTLGVGRLNTRLAFAAYETRKLWAYQHAALGLPAPALNRAELYRVCATLESRNLVYLFRRA